MIISTMKYQKVTLEVRHIYFFRNLFCSLKNYYRSIARTIVNTQLHPRIKFTNIF